MKFQVASKQNFELFNGKWRIGEKRIFQFFRTFDVETSDFLYILLFNTISKKLDKSLEK